MAELTLISGSGIVTIARPEPPTELTEDQAAEWRAVVGRLPADWFPREMHGVLVQYCRHSTAAARIAMLIESLVANPFDLDAYDRLLRMQERESRAISSLATRMRITQQSAYSARKGKPSMTLPKPWERK